MTTLPIMPADLTDAREALAAHDAEPAAWTRDEARCAYGHTIAGWDVAPANWLESLPMCGECEVDDFDHTEDDPPFLRHFDGFYCRHPIGADHLRTALAVLDTERAASAAREHAAFVRGVEAMKMAALDALRFGVHAVAFDMVRSIDAIDPLTLGAKP